MVRARPVVPGSVVGQTTDHNFVLPECASPLRQMCGDFMDEGISFVREKPIPIPRDHDFRSLTEVVGENCGLLSLQVSQSQNSTKGTVHYA